MITKRKQPCNIIGEGEYVSRTVHLRPVCSKHFKLYIFLIVVVVVGRNVL